MGLNCFHDVTGEIVVAIISEPIFLDKSQKTGGRFPNGVSFIFPLDFPFKVSITQPVTENGFYNPIFWSVRDSIFRTIVVEGYKGAGESGEVWFHVIDMNEFITMG